MKTTICLFAWFFTLTSFAQVLHPEALTTGSASQQLQNGYLSWNVGDWMIETYEGATTLEQGFLHAFEFQTEITTNVRYEVLPRASVWPNPAKSHFEVNMEDQLPEEVLLVDNYGQVITNWEVKAQHQSFDISRFPSGQYYVLLRSQGMTTSYATISIIH